MSQMCKCGKCNKWVSVDEAPRYKVQCADDDFPAYTRMRLCKECHNGEELEFSFKQYRSKRRMTLEQENEDLKKEVLRLRNIITVEGIKWMTHHKDEAKKKYWADFIKQIIP